MDPVLIKGLADKGLNIGFLILVMALGNLMAKMTWTAVDGVALPAAPIVVNAEGPTAVGNASTTGAEMNLPELLSWNVFGDHEGVIVEKPPEVTFDESAPAPETKLAFQLQGVSVSPVVNQSSAIISPTKGGAGELYWLGDSVAEKAILSAVFEDRVILKQGDQLETLRFDEGFASVSSPENANLDSQSFKPKQSKSATQMKHGEMIKNYRERVNNKNQEAREIGTALNDVNKGNFESFDKLLNQYGPGMEGKFDRAMKTAGVEQVSQGLRIGPKARSSWLSKVGLRRGDVVKSVNGHSAATLKSNRALVTQVVKSCVAKIEVQRGQRTFIVTYPFCK